MKKTVADKSEILETTTTRKRATTKKTTSSVKAESHKATSKSSSRSSVKKTSTTAKSSKTKTPLKNPFEFSLNTAESLLEISANDDVYEIYASNDEYVLFLGKNSSYFSSAQDNLSLKSKSSEITISKVNNLYYVSTNLDVDISDNVPITNFGKSKDLISFSTADCFKVSAKANKLSKTGEVYNKNKI